jgi:hypothetical protein
MSKYRVFAFSEDVISIYNESNKLTRNKIVNNFTPLFDTVLIFLNYNNKKTLELKLFRNGQELYSNHSHCYDYGNYPIFDFPIELVGTAQQEIKEEPLFQVGDRVYDWQCSWMTITEIKSHGIIFTVCDKKQKSHNFFGEHIIRLSFTEYNFIAGGWSQERPKPLPKIGEWGWFWNSKEDIKRKCCSYGMLIDINEKELNKYSLDGDWFNNFSTENPFEK